MTTITEPGLYQLIFRSNSPIAVPFQKWVFEEVLPSIRKTGGYGKAPSPATPVAPGNQHVLEGKNAAFKHYLSKTLNEALLIPGDPHPAAQEAFEKLEKAFESARWDWQGSVPIRMEFYKALVNYIIRRNCTSDALLMLAIKIHEDAPQGD